MNDIIDKIKNKAMQNLKTLILPEADDIRVTEAAVLILEQKLAKKIILIGNKEKILNSQNKLKTSEVEIIDSEEALSDPVSYGLNLIKNDKGDALVAGSVSTSADVIQKTFKIIGRESKTSVISSCFLMIVPNCEYGENGLLAFADAGVIPNPSSRQLADIAISTAKTFKSLTGSEPKVALVSFSTKGSAKHKAVDKVIAATKLAQEKAPDILFDGELQPDAALVPFVAEKKCSGSPVAGKANVLIFPDLNSGNISYKLVERLAKARAYGPLLQGINKSISDLSRGCSVQDIVDVSAISLARA